MILCGRRPSRSGIMSSGLGQSRRIGRAPGPSGFRRLAVILHVSMQVGDTYRFWLNTKLTRIAEFIIGPADGLWPDGFARPAHRADPIAAA